ncbi:MAG: sulfatase-like hydrolase/transferase [Bacilli bacterium]|nr:sulfatase-like hydrolase/transferase [Bacilli bacterium]
MSKNTIFIVIDSLFYDKTLKGDYRNSPMPFLDKLRKEGFTCTNMYSEASYTEAALVSLLGGIDTLKKGGYLKKMYGKETIMETFRNNGYDTFCNCVQPLVYPSYSYQGLTYEYYNICYEFETLWSYRLEFYSKKYNSGELDDDTFNVIIDLLEDNLKTWSNFFLGLKTKDKIVSFIYPYVDIANLDKNIELLNVEIDKFNGDKLDYVKNLLVIGREHDLFKIHSYNLSKKMAQEDMKKLYYRYKKIIKNMFFKNMFYNLKNNKLILGSDVERKGLIKAYINAIYNRFLYDKIDYRIKSKKAAPSMDTTFNHFENWLLNRNSNKPYFAYIHLDDCHSSEMFYTYDTNDFEKLDEEFDEIANYMNNLPKNYKGSISYDCSLRYADICLARLFKFLEKNNMLENVNIAICADHGSSYTFAPYRSNYVNNVHRENYNIPFVLWNKNISHMVEKGFYNTKDIPATLLDLNNIKIPKEYDGYSLLKRKPRDYVLIENVCGGCPDYNLRDILLGIRNKNYLVVMNLNVHKSFEEGTIHSVYDLKKDKEELHNLKNIVDMNKIKMELQIIKKEFESLKKDVKKNNFKNN